MFSQKEFLLERIFSKEFRFHHLGLLLERGIQIPSKSLSLLHQQTTYHSLDHTSYFLKITQVAYMKQ